VVQIVSGWLLTVKAQFRYQVSLCDTYGGESCTLNRIFTDYFCFPCQYQSTNILYTFLLSKGQTGEAWETSKKSNAVSKIGEHWVEKLPHFFRVRSRTLLFGICFGRSGITDGIILPVLFTNVYAAFVRRTSGRSQGTFEKSKDFGNR
jgi:hypothetical protein